MADYELDKIFVSASKLRDLTEEGVTPFFLYDEAGIRRSCQSLQDQFDWALGFQNYFPIRENANPTILKIISSCGLGVLACGKAELMLAQKCGFRGSQLLYMPMKQDPAAELLALELDAGWIINAPDLIPSHQISRVILRYHPTSIKTRMRRPSLADRSKNGFLAPQLMDAIRLFHARGVTSIGLSLELATSSFQPGYYASGAAALFRFLPEVQQQTGVSIEACYLGDGISPSYQENLRICTLEEEAAEIKALYGQLPENQRPKLFTAFSKQLLERHGLLVTKVLEVRQLSVNFLIVDASMCQYLRPALRQTNLHISILGKPQTENRKRYQVVGYLPEEYDRFSTGRTLPETHPGDICILHGGVCGGRSMSMVYATQPVCAEYLFCADGEFRQIGAARSEEEVLDFLTTW